MDSKETIRQVAQSFVELIRKSEHIVLTCHTNADGDALGSTLGFRHVLMNMGKTADVITPDLAPTCYAWMPGFKTLRAYERQQEECDQIIDKCDLFVMMDFNDLQRVKALGDKLTSVDRPRMLIDHHLDPKVQADVAVSAPGAAATCELIFDLLCQSGLEEYIDTEAASNFYTGIVTDTGGLSYNSSNPDLYELVARLLRKGVDKPYVHDKIFNNKSVRRLKLQGFSLFKKLHKIENLPISFMTLTAEELDRFYYNTGDTEGLVNIPMQIKDMVVSCLIMERPDMVKISLRSKGDFPVNEFSNKYFGGGGHLNAAGGTFNGPVTDAEAVFKEKIVDFYTKWIKKSAN